MMDCIDKEYERTRPFSLQLRAAPDFQRVLVPLSGGVRLSLASECIWSFQPNFAEVGHEVSRPAINILFPDDLTQTMHAGAAVFRSHF